MESSMSTQYCYHNNNNSNNNNNNNDFGIIDTHHNYSHSHSCSRDDAMHNSYGYGYGYGYGDINHEHHHYHMKKKLSALLFLQHQHQHQHLQRPPPPHSAYELNPSLGNLHTLTSGFHTNSHSHSTTTNTTNLLSSTPTHLHSLQEDPIVDDAVTNHHPDALTNLLNPPAYPNQPFTNFYSANYIDNNPNPNPNPNPSPSPSPSPNPNPNPNPNIDPAPTNDLFNPNVVLPRPKLQITNRAPNPSPASPAPHHNPYNNRNTVYDHQHESNVKINDDENPAFIFNHRLHHPNHHHHHQHQHQHHQQQQQQAASFWLHDMATWDAISSLDDIDDTWIDSLPPLQHNNHTAIAIAIASPTNNLPNPSNGNTVASVYSSSSLGSACAASAVSASASASPSSSTANSTTTTATSSSNSTNAMANHTEPSMAPLLLHPNPPGSIDGMMMMINNSNSNSNQNPNPNPNPNPNYEHDAEEAAAQPPQATKSEEYHKRSTTKSRPLKRLDLSEPKYVVLTRNYESVLKDGFKWRKYGQKSVKNNIYPRSYYKCSYEGCYVHKHVERVALDPCLILTTYRGRHTH